MNLLPCPFCGSLNIDGPHNGSIGDMRSSEYVWMHCNDCPCGMEIFETEDRERAVKAWNTRSNSNPGAHPK